MKGPKWGPRQKRKRKRKVISAQWKHKYDFHLVLPTKEGLGVTVTSIDACHPFRTLGYESHGPERWDLRDYRAPNSLL